ncbi:MAG: tRNA pseudouridine(55) synthase TruB [Synechococcaceae cyanobacterium]|nr:tRNA pseudouridine(55) synthase TruB [Synechococcaceae cyanobacterium]
MAPTPFGFLVLDKPAGPTSHDCVSRVRRAYGLRRVGHGGTLDPAVTGVLPIAVGAATRLLPYLPGDKAYRGTIQLGLTTATDDLQGEVLQRRDPPSLTAAELEDLLQAFRGSIQQRPPQVSAVHVNGERAYSLVRRGAIPELAARPVTISRLILLDWDPAHACLSLEVDCSAGTYIRALARDIGERLGCGACLASLRRTRALGFCLEAALPLERLEAAVGQDPPPLSDPLPALAHLPRQQLLPEEFEGWRCGRRLDVSTAATAGLQEQQPLLILAPDGGLAGVARLEADGRLQPSLVLDARG